MELILIFLNLSLIKNYSLFYNTPGPQYIKNSPVQPLGQVPIFHLVNLIFDGVMEHN